MNFRFLQVSKTFKELTFLVVHDTRMPSFAVFLISTVRLFYYFNVKEIVL